MARIDSLRLLLRSEPPTDLAQVEAVLSAISERIDELDHESDTAHARINELLAIRDRLVEEGAE